MPSSHQNRASTAIRVGNLLFMSSSGYFEICRGWVIMRITAVDARKPAATRSATNSRSGTPCRLYPSPPTDIIRKFGRFRTSLAGLEVMLREDVHYRSARPQVTTLLNLLPSSKVRQCHWEPYWDPLLHSLLVTGQRQARVQVPA